MIDCRRVFWATCSLKPWYVILSIMNQRNLQRSSWESLILQKPFGMERWGVYVLLITFRLLFFATNLVKVCRQCVLPSKLFNGTSGAIVYMYYSPTKLQVLLTLTYLVELLWHSSIHVAIVTFQWRSYLIFYIMIIYWLKTLIIDTYNFPLSNLCIIVVFYFRRLMIEKIASHLGDFTPRLQSNTKAMYQYCPIPVVVYPPLENELFCGSYYLKHLCDTIKFPDWPIREPVGHGC